MDAAPLAELYHRLSRHNYRLKQSRTDIATADRQIAELTIFLQRLETYSEENVVRPARKAVESARKRKTDMIRRLEGLESLGNEIARLELIIKEKEYEAAFRAGPWC